MADEAELENLDSTNETTEEVENTEEVVEEETPVVDSEDDTSKLKETNKRLFERAKKAEAELKELKKAPPPVPKLSTPSVDPDELRLLAKGLSDEEIERAKVIAKGAGVSLTEALKDPMFQSYQKDLKEQQKREKAKLGASKGSGQSDEEPLVRPGMTQKEHEEVWKKAMGK